MHLTAGDRVDDKYLIQSVLGAGGFGTVYKATQESLGRTVALKLLADYTDAEVTARLMREAQVLSTIQHRNVIQCFGYGTYQGVPYIAVEFVPGQSLESELRPENPLSCARALEIAIQICDGLHAAHEQGIVHRDLKPANILLCKSAGGAESVKIIDFGLAKVLPEAAINAKFQQLTDMGLAVGSVQYMSPEQCLGHVAGVRSDIYSLGCILYECLTGTRPFDADAAVALMFKHLNEQAPPLHPVKANAASAKLQDILNRAMAKEPGERYPSMLEFRQDLQDVALQTDLYRHNQSAGASPVVPNAVLSAGKHTRSKIAIALVVALLTIGAVLGFTTLQPQAHQPEDSLERARAALFAGDFKMACRGFKLLAEDSDRSISERIKAQLGVCYAYCAEGNTDFFFDACDNVKSLSRADGFIQAGMDRANLAKANRNLLAVCALATELELSTMSNHDDVTALVDYLGLILQRNYPQLAAITDDIAMEKMGLLNKQINQRPADFANLYAMRAKLQAAGAGWAASSVTTSEMLSKLKETPLSQEDSQVLAFLNDLFTFNPRQLQYPKSLSATTGARWIHAIAWLCEYEMLSGHSELARNVCMSMKDWCARTELNRADDFYSIATGASAIKMGTARGTPIRLDNFSDFPPESLLQACLVKTAFDRSLNLLHEHKDTEAVALFDAAVNACEREQIDLEYFYVVDVPRFAADHDPKVAPAAFHAMDKYYKSMPRLAQASYDKRAHVAGSREDLAFIMWDIARTPANLQVAMNCSVDDVRDAKLSQLPDAIADAMFRRARIEATLAKKDEMYKYWKPSYDYFSVHQKEKVRPLLSQLAARAQASDPNLAEVLLDDYRCTIHGVITYPTVADLKALPLSNEYRKKLLTRIFPTLDRAVRTNQLDDAKVFAKAVYDAAVRTDDQELLIPICGVVFPADLLHHEEVADYALGLAEEYARTHKVTDEFLAALKLQQADHLYFTNEFAATDRQSEKFKKAEQLYKDNRDIADRLRRNAPGKQSYAESYADTLYRLARLYVTVGDTKEFAPFWNECVNYYATHSSEALFKARVNEIADIIDKRGHMPEFAKKVRKEALPLYARAHH